MNFEFYILTHNNPGSPYSNVEKNVFHYALVSKQGSKKESKKARKKARKQGSRKQGSKGARKQENKRTNKDLSKLASKQIHFFFIRTMFIRMASLKLS